MHLKRVLDNGRKKVNQLYSIISNKDINLSARRLLLLSVINPRHACARGLQYLRLCVCVCLSVCYHSSSGIVHFYARNKVRTALWTLIS